MDLTDYVQGAKLWNRDPGRQDALLTRKLRAEGPETILDLYEQLQWRTSDSMTAATNAPSFSSRHTVSAGMVRR